MYVKSNEAILLMGEHVNCMNIDSLSISIVVWKSSVESLSNLRVDRAVVIFLPKLRVVFLWGGIAEAVILVSEVVPLLSPPAW